MTPNQEIIETLKVFYMLGRTDGITIGNMNDADKMYQDNLKWWWNNHGKKLFPHMELEFENDKK